MQSTRVAIYFNVARDGESPVWLRVGFGRIRHDGSLLACLDHLPADGRVRLQAASLPDGYGDLPCGADAPRRNPRPSTAGRRPPPLPAVRRRLTHPQEETPW